MMPPYCVVPDDEPEPLDVLDTVDALSEVELELAWLVVEVEVAEACVDAVDVTVAAVAFGLAGADWPDVD